MGSNPLAFPLQYAHAFARMRAYCSSTFGLPCNSTRCASPPDMPSSGQQNLILRMPGDSDRIPVSHRYRFAGKSIVLFYFVTDAALSLSVQAQLTISLPCYYRYSSQPAFPLPVRLLRAGGANGVCATAMRVCQHARGQPWLRVPVTGMRLGCAHA